MFSPLRESDWLSESDCIGDEGIIALLTNNSFLEQIAFDGVRKNLERDFDLIYTLDLGGNLRKNPKLAGSTHNVFGIQVGVSINIFVRNRSRKECMPISDIQKEQTGWRQYIVSTPEVISGKPRINGTRIPVALILGYLAAGNTPEQIISEFPDIKREHIAACLDYARELAEYKVV